MIWNSSWFSRLSGFPFWEPLLSFLWWSFGLHLTACVWLDPLLAFPPPFTRNPRSPVVSPNQPVVKRPWPSLPFPFTAKPTPHSSFDEKLPHSSRESKSRSGLWSILDASFPLLRRPFCVRPVFRLSPLLEQQVFSKIFVDPPAPNSAMSRPSGERGPSQSFLA